MRRLSVAIVLGAATVAPLAYLALPKRGPAQLGVSLSPAEPGTAPVPAVTAHSADSTAHQGGEGEFRSARTCQPCHPDIHEEWSQSAMARSVALAGWSLRQSLAVLRTTGESETIRELCYACHAPFARREGSLALDIAPLDEGVSCDYCHSIRSVEASPHINVAVVMPGNVKTGPHADVDSPGHAALALPLMRRSEFCAGCHYFAWPETGMPVDWTYAQWAASPYRGEGVECQSCHMPRRPGRSSTLASTPDRGGVASHRFAGARDPVTLRGAVALRARREDGTAVIEIENVGAGHSIPGGGGDLRQLELRVAPAGGRSRAEVRHYGLRYFDEDGEPVSSSDDGAVRVEDTTIKARETRVERIPLAPTVAATVELRFWLVSEEAAERDGGTPESVLVTAVPLAPVPASDGAR